jgi:putative ABC transport system permease protein
MRLAVAGLVAGLVVVFAVMRLLSSLLFGVSSHDPMVFGGVSLILTTVAILACYIPRGGHPT